MEYNYYDAVKEDIKNYLEDSKHDYDFTNRERVEERLYDDLFIDDSVTGNASGSYTCNAWQAEEYLCHNMDLLSEALAEFGDDITYLERGAECCDVTIRCYLLSQLLPEVLDEFINDMED